MTTDKAKVSAGNLPKPAANFVHSLALARLHVGMQAGSLRSISRLPCSVRPISHRRASKGEAFHSPALVHSLQYVSPLCDLSGKLSSREAGV